MWTRADWKRLHSVSPPPEWQFFILFSCAIGLGIYLFFSRFPILWGAMFSIVLAMALNGRTLRWLNRMWFLFGCALAWMVQPLILSLFYFLLFVPFSVVLFLLRKKRNASQWSPVDNEYRFDKAF
jgi:hypothetical protein